MVDAGFVTAALAGLTGSLHCLAMCGGYLAVSSAGGAQPLRPLSVLRAERAVTQLGRLCT
jgi:sulfite exporter TauE/SafE